MYIKVMEGETAEQMAVRLKCPLCMLLRANGLLSGAWLEMMDEVRLPDADECEKNAFPCPNVFSKARIPEKNGYIVRQGDTAESVAIENGLPERIVTVCSPLSEGKTLFLPNRANDMKIHTVKPGEAWKNFKDDSDLKLINMHYAPLYPGMKILIKRKQ